LESTLGRHVHTAEQAQDRRIELHLARFMLAGNIKVACPGLPCFLAQFAWYSQGGLLVETLVMPAEQQKTNGPTHVINLFNKRNSAAYLAD
jgi:hypothetical protein